MRKIFLILVIFGLMVGNFSFAQMTKEMGGTEDIMTKMPQPEFISPKEGMELEGTIKIEIEVEGAQSVEFYLRKPESLIEIYLGKAILTENNIWEYSWDTTQTPNGDYYFFLKITTEYGEYSYSDVAIKITVNNPVARNTTEEEKLATETQKTEEAIQKEETIITQTQTQTTEQIQTNMESLTQESKETLEPAGKETVESEVNQSLEESTAGIEENVSKLTEKIKEEVKATEEELARIQKEKEAIKKEIIEKATEPVKPVEEIAKEEVKSKISEKKKVTKERIGSLLEEMESKISESEKTKLEIAKKLLRDSDNDNLPDHEEIRLGTNPFNPDTDGDGFSDGTEVAGGYNPLKPSPADKIVYQDPRKVEPKMAETYKVERIEMVTLPTGELGLKFEGKGQPNSFVTLYIYSPLLVLTTKTDENGYWEYILDKPLEEGHHEIYVTVTNNKGEIAARSERFPFLLKAGAVAAIEPSAEEVISPAESFQRASLILLVAIIIFAIGVALIIIGILTRRAKKEIKD